MEMPSAWEAAERIRGGDLSASGLLDGCLAAIEERNGELNAFVHVDATSAREQARTVDRDVAAGRLDGLGSLAGSPSA